MYDLLMLSAQQLWLQKLTLELCITEVCRDYKLSLF